MQRVCVYCGSSPGKRSVYQEHARQLGREMVSRDLGLVYGGASIGVMGAIADEVLAGNGTVYGVITQGLLAKEIAHPGLTELEVVASMHTRKARMAELADAFIALPGGLGTLEELFETLTWALLGLHQKPCGLLNMDGYFDPLLRFLDHAVEEAFVRPQHRNLVLVDTTAVGLLDQFAAYQQPAPDTKWLREGET